jgi:hypothetical protein
LWRTETDGLHASKRAPTIELQKLFNELKSEWEGLFPSHVECRVETDLEKIDDILLRRHTGVQGGIGQATWDGRMKSNFISRTGKNKGPHIADAIESILDEQGQKPTARIPRTNMARLLSSETIRNRVGISFAKGTVKFTRNQNETIVLLARIASDLSDRRVTLEDIWDNKSKLKYLDDLEQEGLMPRLSGKPPESNASETKQGEVRASGRGSNHAPVSNRLFDIETPSGLSAAHHQRLRQIWEELRFKLDLTEHPNAIAVLLRVLLELAVENYAKASNVNLSESDNLAKKITKVAESMKTAGKID